MAYSGYFLKLNDHNTANGISYLKLHSFMVIQINASGPYTNIQHIYLRIYEGKKLQYLQP